MFNQLFLLISIVFMANMSFAYDIKSRLELVSNSETWKEGEIKTALLTLWPITEVDTKYINKQILGKSFVDSFFVSKINTSAFSLNNPEAYQINFDLVLMKKYDINKLKIWSYKGINIPIRLENIDLLEDKTKPKEFVIKHTKEEEASTVMVIILSVLFLVVIGSYLILRKKNSTEMKEVYVDWRNVLLKSNTREDFEYIYLEREKWMKELGGENPQFINLLQTINHHQYKKKWNDSEFESIEFVFSEIKDSLNDA